MIETSARLALPLMAAGQAQKEIVHNEALLLADLLVAPVAENLGLNAPPTSPAAGACWIIGTAPTGDWAGHAGALAGWTAGGWRFAAPFEGLHVWLRARGCGRCAARRAGRAGSPPRHRSASAGNRWSARAGPASLIRPAARPSMRRCGRRSPAHSPRSASTG